MPDYPQLDVIAVGAHPDDVEIEIVRWPAQGVRPIDEGTGDEGGYVEGVFHGDWRGDVLYGANEAVNGNYVLGWSPTPRRPLLKRKPHCGPMCCYGI